MFLSLELRLSFTCFASVDLMTASTALHLAKASQMVQTDVGVRAVNIASILFERMAHSKASSLYDNLTQKASMGTYSQYMEFTCNNTSSGNVDGIGMPWLSSHRREVI